MHFEPDKISSYYHKSAKPFFLFYRTSLIVSMVALLGGLGVNLYSVNRPTSTTSRAAYPSSFPSVATPTPMPAEPTTAINVQTLPPLPPQCKYDGNTVICTEKGRSCTYRIVNNKYVMTCDK